MAFNNFAAVARCTTHVRRRLLHFPSTVTSQAFLDKQKKSRTINAKPSRTQIKNLQIIDSILKKQTKKKPPGRKNRRTHWVISGFSGLLWDRARTFCTGHLVSSNNLLCLFLALVTTDLFTIIHQEIHSFHIYTIILY